jgi:hyperosmotically inducible periplasmic protein
MNMPSTGRTRLPSLLAIAALTTVACTVQPARTAADAVADRSLAARVERALADDPHVFARHVDVESRAGVVYLSGYVWSTEDLYATRRIAANVPGVSRVDSELQLLVGGRNGR